MEVLLIWIILLAIYTPWTIWNDKRYWNKKLDSIIDDPQDAVVVSDAAYHEDAIDYSKGYNKGRSWGLLEAIDVVNRHRKL